MSCTGPNAINPLCHITDAASIAATDAFTHIASWFGKAAAEATRWLWQEISSATSINLNSGHLAADLAATGAIAVVLCLGLFLLQVITGVLRRDPGSLGRAARGLLVALVASSFALAVTKILLGIVDKLSAGVVQYTMNTNIEGLGRQLAIGPAIAAYTYNPAMTLLLSLAILAAVVMIWAAMMIRKMMIIIAAVLTPLAFSGATADITRSWARKWIEFMAAMIAAKLLLVIILMVGVSVVEGAGQAPNPGAGQQLTQLATGSLILLMGGFTPWVAIKMFQFAGDSLHAAHTYVAQAPAGAHAVVAAPQKLIRLHTHTSMAAATVKRLGQNRSDISGTPQRDSGQLLHDRLQRDGTTDSGPVENGAEGDALPTYRHGQSTGSAGRGPASGVGSGTANATGANVAGDTGATGAGSAGGSAAAAGGGGTAAAGGPAGAAVAAGGAPYTAGRQAAAYPGKAAEAAAPPAGDEATPGADRPDTDGPADRPPTRPT